MPALGRARDRGQFLQLGSGEVKGSWTHWRFDLSAGGQVSPNVAQRSGRVAFSVEF